MHDARAKEPLPRLLPAIAQLRGPLILASSRGLGVLAQVALQIAVGALGGAAALGLLQLFASWTGVIAELVSGGYPTRILRDTSVNAARGDRKAIALGLRQALRKVLGYGLITAAAIAACVTSGLIAAEDVAARTMLAVACCAPLFAAARLCAEALKGLEHPIRAVALENLSLPATLLLLCALLASADRFLTPALLLAGAALGTFITLALLALSLHRCLNTAMTTREGAEPIHVSGEQLHFWANGLLNIAFLQLPFLLLPLFSSAEEIGHFAVAHKLVNIITTLLILMAALFGPRFSRAAANQDVALMRHLLMRTQLISSSIFVPAAAMLLLFAQQLAPLFSVPATSLAPLLWMLCAGQLVNALTGLPGVLLTLSGGARREMQIQLVGTCITAQAIVLAGTCSGIGAAAIAMSAGIALKNIASYLAAHEHLNSLKKVTP
jgi:O-antigen/teichoic acid export membrane protein